MKKEVLLVIILGIIIIALTGVLFFWPKQANGPDVTEDKDVQVFNIKEGDTINSPLVVEGKAKGTWFFEASFPIKITDEAGTVLGSSYVQAQGEWTTTDFVPFKGEISYASKEGGKGFLVLAKDNPSGLPENDKEIKIPVVLSPSEFIKIKIYFNNSKLDPEVSCNKVFPVEREIQKVESIGSAALWELLKGPTDEEKSRGFFTSINSGVILKGLNIASNGIATAEFDEKLDEGVGGSCKVSAIRAQITETLKQFPTVKKVIISINGRTEDILQP